MQHLRTSDRTRGEDLRPVTPQAPARSCSADHAFTFDELDPARHRQAVLSLAEQLGARLRKERQVTGRLTLTVRYADRSRRCGPAACPNPPGTPQPSPAPRTTSTALSASSGLASAASRCAAEELQGAERATRQLTFDPGDDRARRIEAAADKARARFDADAVMPAALAATPDHRRTAPGHCGTESRPPPFTPASPSPRCRMPTMTRTCWTVTRPRPNWAWRRPAGTSTRATFSPAGRLDSTAGRARRPPRLLRLYSTIRRVRIACGGSRAEAARHLGTTPVLSSRHHHDPRLVEEAGQRQSLPGRPPQHRRHRFARERSR
ncbi:hypothetical protein ACFYW6_31305 [Streptomyces sp. NPDC002659]|uniref:DinB/UmuC family translesion DNA polymerase n=1 Tax=Streptomyces sp. NPDC002659 TaxID=3364656 RepID=UPI00368D1252